MKHTGDFKGTFYQSAFKNVQLLQPSEANRKKNVIAFAENGECCKLSWFISLSIHPLADFNIKGLFCSQVYFQLTSYFYNLLLTFMVSQTCVTKNLWLKVSNIFWLPKESFKYFLKNNHLFLIMLSIFNIKV